jgi:hypothetical protein
VKPLHGPILPQRKECVCKIPLSCGLLGVQGTGKIIGQPQDSPKLIRFHELTEDEHFCTENGAKAGVTFENTRKTEPLVFGPT